MVIVEAEQGWAGNRRAGITQSLITTQSGFGTHNVSTVYDASAGNEGSYLTNDGGGGLIGFNCRFKLQDGVIDDPNNWLQGNLDGKLWNRFYDSNGDEILGDDGLPLTKDLSAHKIISVEWDVSASHYKGHPQEGGEFHVLAMGLGNPTNGNKWFYPSGGGDATAADGGNLMQWNWWNSMSTALYDNYYIDSALSCGITSFIGNNSNTNPGTKRLGHPPSNIGLYNNWDADASIAKWYHAKCDFDHGGHPGDSTPWTGTPNATDICYLSDSINGRQTFTMLDTFYTAFGCWRNWGSKRAGLKIHKIHLRIGVCAVEGPGSSEGPNNWHQSSRKGFFWAGGFSSQYDKRSLYHKFLRETIEGMYVEYPVHRRYLGHKTNDQNARTTWAAGGVDDGIGGAIAYHEQLGYAMLGSYYSNDNTSDLNLNVPASVDPYNIGTFMTQSAGSVSTRGRDFISGIGHMPGHHPISLGEMRRAGQIDGDPEASYFLTPYPWGYWRSEVWWGKGLGIGEEGFYGYLNTTKGNLSSSGTFLGWKVKTETSVSNWSYTGFSEGADDWGDGIW